MIDDPYARRSVKLSDRYRMERERVARQKKRATNPKRKQKIQANRQLAVCKRERIQKLFFHFRDELLVRYTSKSLYVTKIRMQIQQERDRLAAADSFFHPEDPDDYDYEDFFWNE